MKNLFTTIATLGPCGYLSAPGTVATALTFVFIYGACNRITQGTFLVLAFCAFLLGYHAIKKSIYFFKHTDPSEIVIDELVGALCIFIGRSITGVSFLLGFLLFRFLDITKPLGIRKIEILRAPWGILLDDIAAGLITNGCLWLMGY